MSIVGILLEKSREQLEVRRRSVGAIELAYGGCEYDSEACFVTMGPLTAVGHHLHTCGHSFDTCLDSLENFLIQKGNIWVSPSWGEAISILTSSKFR